jgi:hypothetical protein
MHKTLTLVLLAVVVADPALAQTPQAAPPPASAPAQPDFPIVRVGMLSYLQYDAEFENRDAYNAFDVTRAYLNVNGQLSDRVRFRFTPDVRRVTDGSLAGSMAVRLKYAFLQVDNLTPRSWIRFGMAQTPWLDFEESVNRYRVQGTMFSEREALIPGSADVGVGYFSSLPGNYGEFHTGVYNGEGFAQAELNKYKSVQGRLTVRPAPGRGLANFFRVSGFYSAGWYAADKPRRVGIVMAHYEHPRLVATVQRVAATESPLATVGDIQRSGWSAFIEPRQGPVGWAGIARFESFDPNDDVTDNTHRRAIGGVAYWFVWNRARLGLLTSNEQVWYDSRDGRRDENRLLFQTHIEF